MDMFFGTIVMIYLWQCPNKNTLHHIRLYTHKQCTTSILSVLQMHLQTNTDSNIKEKKLCKGTLFSIHIYNLSFVPFFIDIKYNKNITSHTKLTVTNP